MKTSIAHIINPVKPKEGSDLNIAQPITFQSMINARNYSRFSQNIELLCVQYPEDHEIIYDDFRVLPDMIKSVLDVRNFEKKRKLPLISDIIKSAYDNTDADFIIYSNVDISIQPYFYDMIFYLIESGYDGFCVNRRVIVNNLTPSVEDMASLYAYVGEPHPGFDCFVFKREWVPSFNFGNACIGANWIGRIILANIIACSVRYKIFTDLHLTFHIGDDGKWHQKKYNDYDLHNLEEMKKIIYFLSGNDKVKNDAKKKLIIESFLNDGTSWEKAYENKKRKIPFKRKIAGKLIHLLKKI